MWGNLHRSQPGLALGCARCHADASAVIVLGVDVHRQVGLGQVRASFVRPFHQLQARAGKQVSETGILPFTGVFKPVKVEMPHRHVTQRAIGLVGLHHGIGRAFDAAGDTHGAQQVPHERGFAGTQVAMQRDDRVARLRAHCQLARPCVGVGFMGPNQFSGVGRVHGQMGQGLCADGTVRWLGAQEGKGKWVGASYNGAHIFRLLMDTASNIVSLCQTWGRELGFSQIGVAGVDLSAAEPGLSAWLAAGFHGSMGYMAHHGLKRARPAELVPGTVSVITARMDYLPRQLPDHWPAAVDAAQVIAHAVEHPPSFVQPDLVVPAGESWREAELARPQQRLKGTVSVYARGRDYHKVLRQRLQKLADRLATHVGPLGHRVFTDSAPVLEVELATRSGQGWRGKHTLVLSRQGGSMFFLGEIYLDLALPPTAPTTDHCGECTACLHACPTQAIVAPYRLDARRCISYLTIEHDGPIPLEFRRAMGNRIYGCDDCQLVCPWNKFAQRSPLPDFDERAGLNAQALAELLRWSEATFLRRTEGGPIRRIGHERWLRNVATAAGNALQSADVSPADRDALTATLAEHADHPSPVVREHIHWAFQA